MDKLIICTVGTSIANRCQAQKNMLKQHNEWDSDAELLKSQIMDFLNKDEHNAQNPQTRQSISVELKTLSKLDIDKNDRIVLLSSDNALGRVCADMNKKAIMDSFGLSETRITIHRIEGLQVHNAKTLKEKGLKNLVKFVVNEYLANEQFRYNYDIVLNPTGGYKGAIPFLTVLGMLYGRRTVYMFEFAEELFYLPPLPFSFDMELYDRVRPALIFAESEVAVTEDAFLSKIKNFIPEERDRFMVFTEPFNSTLLTLSPLAYCLVSSENRQDKPLIAPSAAEELKKAHGIPALMVKRLISNSVNPIWREKHIENWQYTGFLVLKQINASGRIAGFVKSGKFHITHVFTNHDDYLHVLKNCSKDDFNNVSFIEWEETENLGVDSNERDEMQAERDKLLIENKNLEMEIARQKTSIDEKDNIILELTETTEKIEEIRNILKEKELLEKQLLAELHSVRQGKHKKSLLDGILDKTKNKSNGNPQ